MDFKNWTFKMFTLASSPAVDIHREDNAYSSSTEAGVSLD
jgi:hypothetical protein